MKYQVLILALSLAFTRVFAQGDSTKVYVKNVFTNTQLAIAQTTEVLPKKSWEFKIQHRFGKVGIDSSLYQEFLGMDQTANVRLALGYSLSDRFYVGVGRTKADKNYDFEGKYLLLRQSEGQKIPISIAAYTDIAIRTAKFPRVPDNAYFKNLTTPFEYKPTHRLSYNTQLIFSSKINDDLSLQFTPIFVYRNLVGENEFNQTLTMAFSGRYKIGMSSALFFEYAHVVNRKKRKEIKFVNPATIGIEFGTAAHVFQLFISSTQNILEQRVYTNTSYDYGATEFLLGFNIKRNFFRR